MFHAALQFFGQLNDFLPIKRQRTTFDHTFDESPSIKDMIQSVGVPHTEVRCMMVNGNRVDFGYRVRNGDNIAVYPSAEPDQPDVIPSLPADVRFVLDVHLGRLAAYLRMLGYD